MQMRVDEIIVKKRIRKELGDLATLIESIKKHGLLNPITVNARRELIAGERRLESVKRLGWQTVPVKVLDDIGAAEKIEIELEENIHRRELTADELADGFTRLEKLRNPGLLRRVRTALGRFFAAIGAWLKRHLRLRR